MGYAYVRLVLYHPTLYFTDGTLFGYSSRVSTDASNFSIKDTFRHLDYLSKVGHVSLLDFVHLTGFDVLGVFF